MGRPAVPQKTCIMATPTYGGACGTCGISGRSTLNNLKNTYLVPYMYVEYVACVS